MIDDTHPDPSFLRTMLELYRKESGWAIRPLFDAYNETGVQNITFNTIVDYIVLVTYLMKCLGFTKTEIRKLILDFKNCYEDLRKRVPAHIYSVIIHTDTRSKLQKLETYV